MKQLNKEITKVFKYFSIFAYHPTGKEIYTFLQAKISRNSLNIELDRMVKQKLIVNCKLKIENSDKYTPPQYSIRKKISNIKYQISKRKLNNWRYKAYIQLLSLFPQIKLIGLSGSISMMNAGKNDDIDLFIITGKNRLFTGRLISLILAQLLGFRRSREVRSLNFYDSVGTLPSPSAGESQVAKNFNSSLSSNKVCLNLFFDERNLKVPRFKQTEFVGHEVLQMKPIIIKGNIYEKFLEANLWVFRIFPNAKQVFSIKYPVSRRSKILNTKYFILDTLFNKIESILKKLQLRLINKHKTTEIITATQLWFHPNDFEKKIKY